MAAFVASGGRLGGRRPGAAAVARAARQVGVASAATRRAPLGMVAETPVAEGNASSPLVKLEADKQRDTSLSVVQSMDDVEAIISMAAELQMGDLRLSHEGVTLEVTFPGGAGFDAEGNLQVPPPPVMAAAPAAVAAAPAATYVDAPAAAEEEEEADEPDAAAASTPKWDASSDDGAADGGGVVDSDFTVSSNRVGFFYSGAKNKPPLVNVGDHVGFNQPVCIIEQLSAQYVYKSEVSGTVVAVCLEDGDAVEYGQKLMAIRPD